MRQTQEAKQLKDDATSSKEFVSYLLDRSRGRREAPTEGLRNIQAHFRKKLGTQSGATPFGSRLQGNLATIDKILADRQPHRSQLRMLRNDLGRIVRA